jgi:hypothetical protein
LSIQTSLGTTPAEGLPSREADAVRVRVVDEGRRDPLAARPRVLVEDLVDTRARWTDRASSRARLTHPHRSRPDAAKKAMDFILDVYRIERAALDADILGSPEHLELRQTQGSRWRWTLV